MERAVVGADRTPASGFGVLQGSALLVGELNYSASASRNLLSVEYSSQLAACDWKWQSIIRTFCMQDCRRGTSKFDGTPVLLL